MSTDQIVLIGLDSFDHRLADPWLRAGLLPSIAALCAQSTLCPVTYAPGLESGSVWPSFFRGKDPSHHGQYDGTRYFNPETYELSTFQEPDLKPDALWSVLTSAGKRSIFIDPPYMPLPADHNGIIMIDWCAHFSANGEGDLEPASLPPDFAAEVIERYGADTLGGRSCDNINPHTAEQITDFRDALIERIRIKTALTKDLMAGEQWDLFSTVFCEAHCVAHQCLHLSSPLHPQHDAEMAARIGDPVKDIYIALDEAVGEILEALPDSVQVMLYLSHGTDVPYTGAGLLDRILQRLEGVSEPPIDSVGRTLRSYWRRLPPGLKTALDAPRHLIAGQLRRDRSPRDRLARKFFEVPVNFKTGGIRLNLVGREAHGQVEPENYDKVCQTIVDALTQFQNDETGEPLVENIQLSRDLFDGPRQGNLPDILVTWNRDRPINKVSSPTLGTLSHVVPTARTGDHHFEGLFVDKVIDRPSNRINHAVDVIHLAPTITARLGIDLPEAQGDPVPALMTLP